MHIKKQPEAVIRARGAGILDGLFLWAVGVGLLGSGCYRDHERLEPVGFDLASLFAPMSCADVVD